MLYHFKKICTQYMYDCREKMTIHEHFLFHTRDILPLKLIVILIFHETSCWNENKMANCHMKCLKVVTRKKPISNSLDSGCWVKFTLTGFLIKICTSMSLFPLVFLFFFVFQLQHMSHCITSRIHIYKIIYQCRKSVESESNK